ncbi:MAG: thioredoxin family protein [Planctomycetota bacterium]
MKRLSPKWLAYGSLLAAVLVLAAVQSWPVEDRVPWRTDLTAEVVAPADRPTLLYFTADWCPPCRAMTRRVFSHGPTADAIAAATTPVKVDLTDQAPGPAADLARSFRADAIPTLVLLDPQGRELGRVVGQLDRQELVSWLDSLARADNAG